MSKIFLEILLKYSDKKSKSSPRMTDEEITEILNRPDWREKAQFEVGDYYNKKGEYRGECLGHWWCIPWVIDAREPIEIMERLNKEANELNKIKNEKKIVEENYAYLVTKTSEDKKKLTGELHKLEEELKEKKVLIKELEDENDFLAETAECNLDAIKKCEEWERREKGKLKEEIDNKQTLMKECFDEYVKKDRELRTANKWLEESQQNLRENRKEGLQKDEKIKRLEEQLSLANKPNKIKLFGKEIKTKLRQFTQKFKLQKETMVAQIEVPVKK